MSELTAACFGSDGWPTVSVVMPVRNEAAHLERAVASILAQDYPLPFDVCLAIAPSDDRTGTIATELASKDPRVRLVHNPTGVTPAGLNAAIAASSGSVIVRVDGHAELSERYIRRAVETMRRTAAVNVGGIQAAAGETRFERAVAAAMTSWLGTGGSRFHVGGVEGPVDTVYLGVFDRAVGDAVGWFDERLIRNQDYEFNIRIRQAGGIVWFDPELSASYRPRGTVRTLATQYFQYGWWKAEVVRLHPRSLKARQVAPALSLIAQLIGVLGWRFSKLAALPAVVYIAAIAAGVSRSKDPAGDRLHRARTAVALWTMHQAWATGVFGSAARLAVTRRVARGRA